MKNSKTPPAQQDQPASSDLNKGRGPSSTETGTGSSRRLTDEAVAQIAKHGYVYAYPLVIMDFTRRQMTNYEKAMSTGLGPANRFIHAREFPDARLTAVVRPNVDTLYSSAWIDLEQQPLILSVPATDRYIMLPILSAWTDVIAVPGSRTTGTTMPRNFALVGPTWKKEALPENIEIIQCPTRWVWIIGRTQTNGEKDYAAIHKIQDGLKLTPLNAWGKEGYEPATPKIDPSIDMKTPPPQQVDQMDAATYFGHFARLLKDNPPYFYDQPIIDQLRQIGFGTDRDFDLKAAPEHIRKIFEQGLNEGKKAIEAAVKQSSGANQAGWKVPEKGGFYGADYLQRAAVASYGLGMNRPEDAIYPSTGTDSEGKPLNGKNQYVLHFNKEQMPPVNAFWSITAYDERGYLIPNPLNRYALRDRDPLQKNADGSLDLYFQAKSPGPDKEANWLPVAEAPFNLLLRLYSPQQAIISGKWQPPLLKMR